MFGSVWESHYPTSTVADFETGETVPSVPVSRETAGSRYSLNAPDSGQRTVLEKFIAERFSAAYGAAIVEFFPLLLARFDDSRISSVVGLRPGTDRPLFLEQYLDAPLEQVIAKQSGVQVDRNSLMEIGNLASRFRSGNQLTFILLCAILSRAGYNWVVFTATEQVRALLARLDFHPVTLCEADVAKLVNKQQVWGNYYQAQPKVQAGNLQEGMAILQTTPFSRKALELHAEIIDELAEKLRSLRQQQ